MPNRTRRFKINAVTLALATCFAGVATANPQAPTVVAGQASIQQSGKTLSITNTPGAIINWQSFNIDRGELTRFIQQNAQSQVLNRVTGVDPSKILGNLQSNGRVLLINPNGVLFGKDARVDVAGLLVSTLQIKDADFLAGKYKFNDTPGAGKIENQGNIQTAIGGQVILIAPQIENSGLIHAPEGQILLAAGKSVTLADPDKPSIQVEITNSEQKAVNLGSLIAKEISIYGGLIKNTGLIQATTAQVGANGKISLRAKYDVENTGTIQANGSMGGDIVIQAEQGTAKIQGIVEAKALTPEQFSIQQQATQQIIKQASAEPIVTVNAANEPKITPEVPVSDYNVVLSAEPSARGAVSTTLAANWLPSSAPAVQITVPTGPLAPLNPNPINPNNPLLPNRQQGQGGSVRVLGRSVRIEDGATLTATGANSGGEILVGGDYQGKNAEIQNAQTTFVAATAKLDASALENGNGGKIVVWSDGLTEVHGSLVARGGANSGYGGFIETSGRTLGFAGISVAAGKRGLWLIDPTDVTIDAAGAAIIVSSLNDGSDVYVETIAETGTGSGDINVTSDIVKAAGSEATLTLSAYRDINFNASIKSTEGKLNLELDSGGAINLSSGTTLSLNAGVLTVTIPTNGVMLNGSIDASSVRLIGNGTPGDVIQSSTAVIAATNLYITDAGAVRLLGQNDVRNLAASASSLIYNGVGNLKLVSHPAQIDAAIKVDGDATIRVTGDLTIQDHITNTGYGGAITLVAGWDGSSDQGLGASATGGIYFDTVAKNGEIKINSAGGNVLLKAAGNISYDEYDDADIYSGGGQIVVESRDGDVNLSRLNSFGTQSAPDAGSVTVTATQGSIYLYSIDAWGGADGGESGIRYGGGKGGNVSLSAGFEIGISSYINASGGHGVDSGVNGGDGGAGGNVTLTTVDGNIYVINGISATGGNAWQNGSGADGGAGGNVSLSITGTTDWRSIEVGDSISTYGGDGGEGQLASGGNGGHAGSVTVSLTAANNSAEGGEISLQGIYAYGGSAGSGTDAYGGEAGQVGQGADITLRFSNLADAYLSLTGEYWTDSDSVNRSGAFLAESMDGSLTVEINSVILGSPKQSLIRAANDLTVNLNSDLQSAVAYTSNINGAPIHLEATNGNLTVINNTDGSVSISTMSNTDSYAYSNAGSLTMTAGGDISISSYVSLNATGISGYGDISDPQAHHDGSHGGVITLTAGGAIFVGNIDVSGGNGQESRWSAYEGFTSGRGGNAGQVIINAGSTVITRNIEARGGKGGDSTEYGGSIALAKEGGQGGVLTVRAGGDVSISSVYVSGGDGGTSYSQEGGVIPGGSGGNAGSVDIQTAGGSLSIEDIRAVGGSAGEDYEDRYGGRGGHGGSVILKAVGISYEDINASGGDGGQSGSYFDSNLDDSVTYSGGRGGNGGNVTLESVGSGGISGNQIYTSGGDGEIAGGYGGNVTLSTVDGNIDIYGSINAQGGNGFNGSIDGIGNVSAGADGGAGGHVSVSINGATDDRSIFISGEILTRGGDGGEGFFPDWHIVSLSAGGKGAAGGNATLSIAAAAGATVYEGRRIYIGDGINTSGGNGARGAAEGVGGPGGNVNLSVVDGDIQVNGSINSAAGHRGWYENHSYNTVLASTRDGSNGGSVTFTVSDATSARTIKTGTIYSYGGEGVEGGYSATENFVATAEGGNGGDGGHVNASISAALGENASGSLIALDGIQTYGGDGGEGTIGGAGGRGGNVTVNVADGDILIGYNRLTAEGLSSIHTHGGEGGSSYQTGELGGNGGSSGNISLNVLGNNTAPRRISFASLGANAGDVGWADAGPGLNGQAGNITLLFTGSGNALIDTYQGFWNSGDTVASSGNLLVESINGSLTLNHLSNNPINNYWYTLNFGSLKQNIVRAATDLTLNIFNEVQTYGKPVTLTATAGDININGQNGGAIFSTGDSGWNNHAGDLTLTAGRDINAGNIDFRAVGGDGWGYTLDSAPKPNGGNGGIMTFRAGGNIALGSVDASGGNGQSYYNADGHWIYLGGHGGNGGQVIVNAGGWVETGDIYARGGSGGGAGSNSYAYGGTVSLDKDGGNGGQITVTAGDSIALGSADVSGGRGGDYFWQQEALIPSGNGGNAGRVNIQSTGGSLSMGNINAQGGNIYCECYDIYGGYGGDGGSVFLLANGIGLGGINTSGGHGGWGGSYYDANDSYVVYTGGRGGNAGSVELQSTGSGEIAVNWISAQGGNGAIAGGRGGDVTLSTVVGNIRVDGSIYAEGGNGYDGSGDGFGNVTTGGDGGAGGHVTVSITGALVDPWIDISEKISTRGGSGGQGYSEYGEGGNTYLSAGGKGGAGGNVTVSIAAAAGGEPPEGNWVRIGEINTIGGYGGEGTIGGAGGRGGNVTVNVADGDILIGYDQNSAWGLRGIYSNGGSGGDSYSADALGGNGGDAGNIALTVSGNNTAPRSISFSSLDAGAGDTGWGEAGSGASGQAGDITLRFTGTGNARIGTYEGYWNSGDTVAHSGSFLAESVGGSLTVNHLPYDPEQGWYNLTFGSDKQNAFIAATDLTLNIDAVETYGNPVTLTATVGDININAQESSATFNTSGESWTNNHAGDLTLTAGRNINAGNINFGAIGADGWGAATDVGARPDGGNGGIVTFNAGGNVMVGSVDVSGGNGQAYYEHAAEGDFWTDLGGNGGNAGSLRVNLSNTGSSTFTIAEFAGLSGAAGDADHIAGTKGYAKVTAAGNLTLPAYGEGTSLQGDFTAIAAGDLTLGNALDSSAGNITLVAGHNFISSGGSLSTDVDHRWLVYSTSPLTDSLGGMTGNFKHYGQTYTDGVAYAGPGVGNGFLYSVTPTLAITLDPVSRAYNGTTGIALSQSNFLVSGQIPGDQVAIANTQGVFDSANAGTRTVTASGLSVTASKGQMQVYGYGLNSTASNSASEITKADLTVTTGNVSKTYDGSLSAAGSATVSGTLYSNASNGGALDSISGGAFAFTNANAGIGNKTVTVSGVTVNDGNSGGNYNITYANNTTSTINKADLTVTTNDVSKTYDGTMSATGSATATGTLYNNASNGGALDSISGGTLAFTNANAGIGNKTVMVSGVTVNDGNGGGNYNVTYANNTTSTINKAHLTVTADDKTRLFGYDNPSLTTTVSGFVNGENASTATGFTGAGIATTTATSTSYVGTESITAGVGTLAATNYDFPTLRNGTLTILVDPANFRWAATQVGAWESPTNWNQGVVPVVGSQVTIPSLPGALTYNVGSTTLKSLNSGASLNVNGGILNLGQVAGDTSTFASGKNIIVAGGTLGVKGGLVADKVSVQSGTLNLNDAVISVINPLDNAGTLNVLSGQLALNEVHYSGNGQLNNAGQLTGSNLTINGFFTNTGTSNFTNMALSAGFANTGTINVLGNLQAGGVSATQAGGSINLNSGATLTKNTGTLYWSGGEFGGNGTLAFTNGGLFAFAGNGDRVINNPNLIFNFTDLTLPDGSLTVRNGILGLAGTTTIPNSVTLSLSGGTLDNAGQLNVGGTFNLTGGNFIGSGGIAMLGGGAMNRPAGSTVNWQSTGNLSNTGTLNLDGGTITNAIDNQGTIVLGAGTTFTQTFTNTGELDVGSGTTVFQGGYNQNSGLLKLAGGDVQGQVKINGGSLGGSGTINGDLVVGAGNFAPGFSPGAITVNGNLTLLPSSVLTIELGGLAQGSGYDFINVLGTANLAGTLNVNSWGGYIAAPGTNYTFMNFGNSTGAFAAVNMPAGWNISLGSKLNALQLNMANLIPAAVTSPLVSQLSITPLEALIQSLQQNGFSYFDPMRLANNSVETGFEKVIPNDMDTSLAQMINAATRIEMDSREFDGLKQCN